MSDEYTWVEGHRRRKPGPHQQSFRRTCAFCKGTGTLPDSILGSDCPSCQGKGSRMLPGKLEDYTRCGKCNGSGIAPHSISMNPCHICDGTGIVL